MHGVTPCMSCGLYYWSFDMSVFCGHILCYLCMQLTIVIDNWFQIPGATLDSTDKYIDIEILMSIDKLISSDTLIWILRVMMGWVLFLLKVVPSLIFDPLAWVWNSCLIQSIFTIELKTANLPLSYKSYDHFCVPVTRDRGPFQYKDVVLPL